MLLEVCELAVPLPDPVAVDAVEELVEVDAFAPESVEPHGAAEEPPAVVDDDDPVFAWADESPLEAWLPVDVVVPV